MKKKGHENSRIYETIFQECRLGTSSHKVEKKVTFFLCQRFDTIFLSLGDPIYSSVKSPQESRISLENVLVIRKVKKAYTVVFS
jgi:hypothetical protein